MVINAHMEYLDVQLNNTVSNPSQHKNN